jgi:hypothetical protein
MVHATCDPRSVNAAIENFKIRQGLAVIEAHVFVKKSRRVLTPARRLLTDASRCGPCGL